MRLEQKKGLLEVVRLFYELHQEVKKSIQKKNEPLATDLLIQCQQRGEELGNAIEAILGEGTESVSLLEEYCEHVYEMSTVYKRGDVQRAAGSVHTEGGGIFKDALL